MRVLTVLTLILIVLKLVGIINWSWWIVVLPTLLDIGIAIGHYVLASIVATTHKNPVTRYRIRQRIRRRTK